MRTAEILVADDDESSVRYLKRLLIREGHRVAVVSTVDEALKACEHDATIEASSILTNRV
jgi:CheY-like chemotaxis protein